MGSKFRCIFINVNSVISISTRHFLNQDVLLYAEHTLSFCDRFQVNGFTIFRQNREGRGGIQSCAARVWKDDGSSIVFVSMYIRPRAAFQI